PNLVGPITEPEAAITAAAGDGGEVIGIAVAVAPRTALIVVACPESGAIPVAVGVLIHPDRTHPVPVAAAGLARLGSAEILRIAPPGRHYRVDSSRRHHPTARVPVRRAQVS